MQATEERLFGLRPKSTVYRAHHFQDLVEILLMQSNQMLPQCRCHSTPRGMVSQSDRELHVDITTDRL